MGNSGSGLFSQISRTSMECHPLAASIMETKNSEVGTSPSNLLVRYASQFRLNDGQKRLLLRAAFQAGEEVWASVENEVLYRRTAGLLCHHLREIGFPPSDILKEEYAKIARRNMLFEAELRRIAPLMKKEGIRVLLIKGSGLHQTVYRNPGLRPFEDSDWVLENESDIVLAGRVLKLAGYELRGDEDSPKWVRGVFSIELHRNFLGDERIIARASAVDSGEEGKCAGRRVWDRSISSPLGGPYLIPAPEDHLIILCCHLMKHNLEPGIWFVDIQALLEDSPAFDWGAFLSRALSWGLLRPVVFTFRNLGVLDGTEEQSLSLPVEVKRAMASVRLTFLDKFLLSLAERGARVSGEKDAWGRIPVANLLWLSSMKTFGSKARLLWEAAFPRSEVASAICPAGSSRSRWGFLVYRTWELVRLAIRVLPLAWSHWRILRARR